MPSHRDRKCFYCGTPETDGDELRPYGPSGAWLCFDCMKVDPERETEAKRQFGARLEHAGLVGGGVATLTDAGIVPGDLTTPPKKDIQ